MMEEAQRNIFIEEYGKILAELLVDFTGNVRLNIKQGRLINWNVEQTGWPGKGEKNKT